MSTLSRRRLRTFLSIRCSLECSTECNARYHGADIAHPHFSDLLGKQMVSFHSILLFCHRTLRWKTLRLPPPANFSIELQLVVHFLLDRAELHIRVDGQVVQQQLLAEIEGEGRAQTDRQTDRQICPSLFTPSSSSPSFENPLLLQRRLSAIVMGSDESDASSSFVTLFSFSSTLP
jgi:hypothetical protein